jgi:hypothetical protein
MRTQCAISARRPITDCYELSRNRSPAPLVRALETDYPNIGAGPLLKVLGVADIRAVSDEETLALLSGRTSTHARGRGCSSEDGWA